MHRRIRVRELMMRFSEATRESIARVYIGREDEEVEVPEIPQDLQCFLKAISHPDRLRILAILVRSPHCVTVLSTVLNADISRISHHLTKLKACGLLEEEAVGKCRVYRANIEKLRSLVEMLEELLNLKSNRRR